MEDKEIKAITESFVQELDKRRTIEEGMHQKHHQFLERWLAKEQRKVERIEKVKTQVTGWGIISILSSIGAAVYHFIFKSGGGTQ